MQISQIAVSGRRYLIQLTTAILSAQAAIFLTKYFMGEHSDPVDTILAFFQTLLLVVMIAIVPNRAFKTHILHDLVKDGTLRKDVYYLTRAFAVQTSTGAAYYLALDDGRVLFLHGDYLAEYDGRKPLTARAFPCTDFSTLRDKTTGQILGLSCTGTRLDPEFTAPENPTRSLPADGTLITDRSYSAIKSDYA